MNRFLVLLGCATALASIGAPRALAQSDDASRLFSHEARIDAAGAPPYRLPLTSEVLAIAHAGLTDVRLYDESGREVPWLLDSGGRGSFAAGERLAFALAPARDARHERRGPARGPTDFVESYVITPPAEAPPRATWNLSFSTRAQSFVAALRIVELGPDGTERELVSTSLYRFQSPLRERLRIPVSGTTTRDLRVELVGQDGFLEPLFSWEATREARGDTTMVIPLEIREQRSEGGSTTLVVARPDGVVPDRLRFTTSTPAFARTVRVEDGAQSEIHRVPDVRDAEHLDVPAAAYRTPTIRIVIGDGGSPPLEGLRVEAVISQPSLVFFENASMLRFGGNRVRAPHYDLDALEGSWMIDRVLDGTTTPYEPALGPVQPSPDWDGGPALAFLHRPGIAVPVESSPFVVALNVRGAPDGASRFVLTPAMLSALREAQPDLRIVDGDSHQWPYLVTGRPLVTMALTAVAPERDGSTSRYELALPVERASVSELRLVPDAELVSRPVRVVGIDARGDEITLASSYLEREPGQAEPITLALDPRRVTALALVVTDGDEAPLAFTSIEASLPSAEVFLVAPPGEYRVLMGDETAVAPSYDLERARSVIEAIQPAEAEVGDVAANPAFHAPSFFERTGAQTVALWVVLVLAVLVLGALTLRASREPEPEPPPVATGSDEAAP